MFASSTVFTLVRLALKGTWGRAYAQVSGLGVSGLGVRGPEVSGPGVRGRRGYAQWLRAAGKC